MKARLRPRGCFIMRTQKTTTPITLPLEAFRVTMLSGSMEVQGKAGSNNIPPKSQAIAEPPPHRPECVGVVPRIDYLTYLATVPNLYEFVGTVERMLGLTFDEVIVTGKILGVRNWSMISGSRNSTIAYCAGDGTATKVRLNLGGRACNGVGLGQLGRFIDWIDSLPDSHPTRLDYNADDITGILSMEVIADCLRKGDYKGYSCGEIIESIGNDRSGLSVYFGGQKSLQRVVFYDKAAESGDELAGIRHEVRCRGARAIEMVELIKGKTEDELCGMLRGKLRGSISLGVKHGKNLDRFIPAEYWISWEAVLGSTRIDRLPIPRRTSLDRSIAWVVRQVARTVAKINIAIPVECIDEFWLRIQKLGTDRLKRSDYGNIGDYSSEFVEDDLWGMFPAC